GDIALVLRDHPRQLVQHSGAASGADHHANGFVPHGFPVYRKAAVSLRGTSYRAAVLCHTYRSPFHSRNKIPPIHPAAAWYSWFFKYRVRRKELGFLFG